MVVVPGRWWGRVCRIGDADPTDGKLVHLDGLNLSHAWMLEGIAAVLPEDDDCWPTLIVAVAAHRASGLASVWAHVHQMHRDSS